MTSEEFSTPGQCCVPDCEVALVVLEPNMNLARLFACKHKLAGLCTYFKAFFEEAKNKKAVQIWGVTKAQLLPFIRWLSKYPKPLKVNDSDSLCSLIFLADRFKCPKLEKQILQVLSPSNPGSKVLGSWLGSDSSEADDSDDDDLEEFGVDAKLKLLEMAENHKGTDACILEACIRLCGDLEIDDVSRLHGEVSEGILAAVYATIGRAQNITLSKVKSVVEEGPCCKRARMSLEEPIEPYELREIQIDKDLFST